MNKRIKVGTPLFKSLRDICCETSVLAGGSQKKVGTPVLARRLLRDVWPCVIADVCPCETSVARPVFARHFFR